LLYRLAKLSLLLIAVLPGLGLFSPVFITGKLMSIKKAREALAASSVKIHANDVMATWKLMVSLVLAPLLYLFYDLIVCSLVYRNRLFGLVPESVPIVLVFIGGFALFGSITYAALRFGEVGMDIIKSLRPLFIALAPHHGNTLQKLRARRKELALEVTELINELGPEMFSDFEKRRIVPDPLHRRQPSYDENGDLESSQPPTPATPTSPRSFFGSNLPRNESLHDLSNIGVFASRPTTPYHPRSRSRTNSVGKGLSLQGFSPLQSKGGVDELSQKIRGEMRQRNIRRKSESGSGWDSDSSSNAGGSGLTMTKKF